MNVIASPGQLRAGLLRWALITIPSILVLGVLSATLSDSGPRSAWFAGLARPEFYPPDKAFGIVWPVLYALMGLAFAMVLAARGAPGRGIAVIAFLVQLAINLAWSPVFFGAHRIAGALGVIMALDVAVLTCMALFYRVRPVAALLLVPYVAWIGFATYLNWEILRLNPDADGRAGSSAVQRIEL